MKEETIKQTVQNSSSSTSAYFLKVVSFVSIAVFVFSLIYSIRKLKEKYIDYPKYDLVEIVEPMTFQTLENGQTIDFLDMAAAIGRGMLARPAMTMARPQNPNNPQDTHGIFTIDRSNSATLTVTTDGGYHEVVCYRYPSWEVVYAETNITEVPFDFLENGNYIVHVFSTSREIRGSLDIARNTNRPRPESRSHRVITSQVSESREEAVNASIDALAPLGTKEILRIESSETNIWPKPVYSRLQTLYSRIPDEAVAVFISVPSYGYILEGAEEHLGQLVHEGHNAAIYRAAAQHPALSGGRIMDSNIRETQERVISLTVLYPDINPDSPIKISPSTTMYVYGPDVVESE